MSCSEVQIESSPPSLNMVEKIRSSMGPLDEWEIEEIENSSGEMGCICYNVAEMKHTSIPRTMKWLNMSAEEGYEEGVLTYAGLLHGLNPDLQYKGDEAAWWVKRVKDEWLLKKVGTFDSDGLRARRHVVRTLFSGSLSKNQDSVLYRSFFGSGLREVHLLPLISKYLVENKGESKNDGSHGDIESLVDITSFVFSDASSVKGLSIYTHSENSFLSFLPLLFYFSPNLRRLDLSYTSESTKVDLSLLQQVNTSKLETLQFKGLYFDSLSPLSLCDLSSLHSLIMIDIFDGGSYHPFNGLSSDITRSLKVLTARRSKLRNISPLSGCDLSCLERLNLSYSHSLYDLSPLRGSDLSSLKLLYLSGTDISDLSPLCECKGLAVEEIYLTETLIKDLSHLSLFDFSLLKKPIHLRNSLVSDLSPLANISYDGVEVNIECTPAARKMRDEGLKSPQTIGKVIVMW